jgi:hypothetical protein
MQRMFLLDTVGTESGTLVSKFRNDVQRLAPHLHDFQYIDKKD